MILGFTGTRHGMTDKQREMVRLLILKHLPTEARHGDCVGADADFHDLIRKMRHAKDCPIVGHVPLNGSIRARCDFDREEIPLPYLLRNQKIVDACELLIVCPSGNERDSDQRHSGTWSCYRYAKRMNRKRVIVYPDGTMQEEG